MTLLSPGVQVKEKDFSAIVPTVASGIGAIAGRFTTGPINQPILISSEDELYNVFGAPNDSNFTEWFTAAEFLKYTNACWVVRAAPTGVLNAAAITVGATLVANETAYNNAADFTPQERTAAGEWISTQPGTRGNSVGVVMVDGTGWTAFTTWCDAQLTSNPLYFPNGISWANYFNGVPGTSTYVAGKAADSTSRNDELHIIVYDIDGRITGTPRTVLEKYEGLSKAADAVDYKGSSIYYAAVMSQQSKYVWWSTHTASVNSGSNLLAWGSSSYDVAPAGKAFAAITVTAAPSYLKIDLTGGVAGTTADSASIQTAYDKLVNTDLYDANLFMTAAFDTATQKHVIESVVYARKDAIGFISPHNTGAPYMDGDATDPTTAITTFKMTTLNLAETYASYAVMDTGFKYVYDRYNSKYRWVPLNGDVAGTCARTDTVADAWYSPGGFNRGGILNVIKLAYNPNQAQRDSLYPKGINPVVAFPGQGVVLFGDRTMTMKPSAFDRINVRRLFLILEKAISIAAKYQLFEFNDTFTRAQFRNMVEPYLRNIQGRRGITDFKVVCDETNNTGDVIDRNEFKADIYVKPARSINYIYLSFVATRTDVSFSTVIGA